MNFATHFDRLWDFNFFRGLATNLLDGFSIGYYGEKVNLSSFLLRSLKAERWDFLGENRSGAGDLSKQGFLPFPSIIRNSKRRTQNPSKSLKQPLLRQKDDDIPRVR